MEDFATVRTNLRRVNVSASEYGDSHGMLSLDGENSLVELTGDLPLAEARSPGWFNLLLSDPDGRAIYIRNALRTSMTFPQDRETRSAEIFPNIVVDDARGLDNEGRCQRIEFGLDGWEACFAYNIFETLSIRNGEPEALRANLEAARYEPRREEPFAPRQIFVVNQLGTFVEFEIDGRSYSIHARTRQRGGSGYRLDGKAYLVGTIEFSEMVDLERAIDACWEWRRFFNQMSMTMLPFTGMAVTATLDPRAPRGSLYLPNDRPPSWRPSYPRADAYHMPLNQWSDRARLGEAMRTWLAFESERNFFRAALDRVIARPGHVAIEDAVALCAGVDSLTELSTREGLPRPILEAMTNAAVAAAADGDIVLDPQRVRGLLGSLQNDDLRRRLRRLVSIAAPEAEADDMNDWIAVILPLRTLGAHGRTPASDQDFIAAPAVGGLAALCARFDLQSAGVPDHREEVARSLPKMGWDEALLTLATFRHEADPRQNLDGGDGS